MSSLLARHELQGRRLVFTGDLVNRGPDSRGVLEQLSSLKDAGLEIHLLLGNHELLLLDYLRTGNFVRFAVNGGISTIRSYVGSAYGDVHRQFVDCFPDGHRLLIEGAKPFFESDEILVTHAGISLARPASRDVKDVVLGSHPELFLADFDIGKLLVCGHYVQRAGAPFVRANFVCLDTGCGTNGGPLSAYLLPEKIFVSA
ncbi:metallophosphoesterase [Pyxidicoccus parkwayensis]|uniref:Metallophosphoesterase n=1 Tax=Pyxidicoccus parkwayensis TaxID=2813578 RepID=A0ABX7P499_9BACT|nr:metallophosphoesterase [Pyxidicoccus parkwaysis]